MPKYQKYVNALFIAAGGLAWLVTQHYIAIVIGHYQLARRLGGATDFLLHGVPLIVGVLAFYLLRQNHASRNFVTDAVSELDKVVWPTKKETQLGTIVVIIAVLLSALFFMAVDWGFMGVIKVLIGA